MKITLVRHGQTEDNYLGVLQGEKNNLLNDTGRRQVLRLKNKLSSVHYDLCFSSPLIRSLETALVVVGDRVVIKKNDRLVERSIGKLEGRPKEEYNLFRFWNYDLNCSDYGVEPVQHLIKRCEDFLADIQKKYSDKSLIVFSHGGTY